MILGHTNSSLTQGLVAYYKFDGNTLDSIGVNNGTGTAISYSYGQVNQAAVFNGTTSFVDCGFDTSLDFTTAMTASCWIQTPTRQNGGYIFSRIWLFGNTVYAFSLDFSSVTFRLRGISGSTNMNWGVTYHDDMPHHLACTLNGSGMTIYYDGLSAATGPFIGAVLQPTSDPLYLGNRWANISLDYYSGKTDELAFWNRCLSADEIKKVYNGGKGFQYPFRRYLKHKNRILKNK